MKFIQGLWKFAAGFVVGVAAIPLSTALASTLAVSPLLPLALIAGLPMVWAVGAHALGHKKTADSIGHFAAGVLLGMIATPFMAIGTKSLGVPSVIRHHIF